jgi:murein DD-endopeptidase MepM/ murein hydrolase activator NlpD
LIFCLITILACVIPETGALQDSSSTSADEIPLEINSPFYKKPAHGGTIFTPTPDAPHIVPSLRNQPFDYAVQYGDSLAVIARNYQVDLQSLIEYNQLANPDILEIGQIIHIPPPVILEPGSSEKLFPNSELVYSPSTISFDILEFTRYYNGFLNNFSEEVDGESTHGWQIVQRVSQEYSVNPRILLALLEFQSQWITQPSVEKITITYPLRFVNENYVGLYRQLSWAANQLNYGYYLWQVGGFSGFNFSNRRIVPPANTLNAGTLGVQYLMSQLYDYEEWQNVISSNGISQTFTSLFGYAFDWTYDPLIPPALRQPILQLPFENSVSWSFTGGPHGGWGSGSGWAALDFAPPGEALGCVPSDAWVTAMADGIIVSSEKGRVVQDLDGDGYEQTGWTLLYMHIETRDRISAGEVVKAGDRIGHPSCEGGISSGTHVHIARRFNGEWIPADGKIPFNLDGWTSEGQGFEYDGLLRRNGKTIEAFEGRKPENQIQR